MRMALQLPKKSGTAVASDSREKMAEKEEAGAPAEDDAVEAAPPADMMEACTLRWILCLSRRACGADEARGLSAN